MKEWFKVARSRSGVAVTCTLQDGNLTAKWAVQTHSAGIKAGAKEAKAGATEALTQLREAVGDA